MTLKRCDRRVQLCWSVYTIIAAVIPLIISVVLFSLTYLPPWIPRLFTLIWIIALIVMLTVIYPLRCRRMRYAIDGDVILSERGLLITDHRRVPLSAVRYITALRGPMERAVGITTLLICAAGGRLLIEGIPSDEAQALSRRIV